MSTQELTPYRGKNYIAGRWQMATGRSFISENPATGEVVWKGNTSSPSDVEASILAAQSAANDWGFRRHQERVDIVEAFQEQLIKQQEDLAVAISREVGKPAWEARTEVQAMIGKIPVSVRALQQRRGEERIDLGGAAGATRYKPHGVLAVFGPFNFPGHISNGHIVPALLAGNTVVFKPSDWTPLVAELTVAAWQESGLPAGVLNLVQGTRDTGIAVVEHAGLNGVLFTGSLKAGLSISRTLADRPETILALELGGNNPLIVDDVDDVDAAVYATLQSAYLTTGQRCTCARRLVVPPGNDSFLDRLAAAIPRLLVGPPESRPEPFMGPLIHSTAVDRVLTEQQRLVDDGATLMVEARRTALGDAFVTPGLIDVTDVADRGDDEVFGPLLQLIRVSDFPAAVAEANKTKYGLVAGLLSRDRDRFEQFYRQVNAGLVNWNRPTTGASGQLPFGGVGRSGNHRPAGYFTTDFCNIPVATLESETLSLPQQLLPGVSLP
jgi:succinylglutamic semialdehyde dehydrogenase